VSAPGAVNRDSAVANEEVGGLYQTRVLLPLNVGCAAIVAGALLSQVGQTRLGVLVVLLGAAVALIVVGAILYFVIGMWLIPGSLVLGGMAVLAAFEVGSHGSNYGALAGVIELSLGAIAASYGVLRWRGPGWFRSAERAHLE
jgi:hypothetical protein